MEKGRGKGGKSTHRSGTNDDGREENTFRQHLGWTVSEYRRNVTLTPLHLMMQHSSSKHACHHMINLLYQGYNIIFPQYFLCRYLLYDAVERAGFDLTAADVRSGSETSQQACRNPDRSVRQNPM